MPKNIRELDLLTYPEKISHWDGDDPWTPPEGHYRFNNPEWENRRVSMIAGDVTAMPLIVGRPCFGILTAYLRFRDATKFVNGMGQQPASRCWTCKSRTHCDRVVSRRIEAAPAIKEAFEKWLLMQGPTDILKPGWQSRSGSAWRRLVAACVAHPFTSTNDALVAAHYLASDEMSLEADRRRQALKRKRNASVGALDPGHVQDLKMAQARRANVLVAAVNQARIDKVPRALALLPNQSVRELLEVWLARETLMAQKLQARPSAIARWIVDHGLSNFCATPNALATRVTRDLERLKNLENHVWNNQPLLAPFDPRTEFSP